MSVSINSNYTNLYGSWNTANMTNTSTSNNQQTASSSQPAFGDYLQLATNNQGNSIGNYDSISTDNTSLTTKQKTAYLETMLKRIQSTDTSDSSNLPEGLQTALSTVNNLLGNFNASSSSEEEISNLFTSVTETLEKSKPSKAEMQANGMTTSPPPPINSNAEQSENTAAETNRALSVDQMKEFISNLISTLNSDSDSTESISDSLSTNLIDQLSEYDETTATDAEVQALFENLMKLLEESQQNTQTATSSESNSTAAFPNSIQMTGASLPPFNWKPNNSAINMIQNSAYSSGVQL
ncbi:hypothetical protein [Niallia sp. NCCP-28]|uniref:hypothetical protein n=1 Tax=Niallia sp. NCCP-28 TaxID=2934712 RepID=UPI0020896AD6|nr:hypothetical protein [Niallia sp. NCCP-28]GKU82180.1 hypothetical protein NCCP28_15760 [Niallia sp. NCCP-28]